MLVAKSQGWDTEPFKEAREQLTQRTFSYPFLSKKRWKSLDGMKTVRLGISMDIDETEVFLSLANKPTTRDVRRILIRRTRTTMLTVGLENKLAESGEWSDDNTFLFTRGTPGIGAGRTTTIINTVDSTVHEVRVR